MCQSLFSLSLHGEVIAMVERRQRIVEGLSPTNPPICSRLVLVIRISRLLANANRSGYQRV
jgi:hypothetical protein